MTEGKLKIAIDFYSRRIRIHKCTIKALGTPEYVLMIVNPTEKTIGLLGCSEAVRGSHKIRTRDARSCELCSKPLVDTIKNTFLEIHSERSCVFEGEYISKENMARFSIVNSRPLKLNEGNA